jgi:uncharacterized protein DUF4159
MMRALAPRRFTRTIALVAGIALLACVATALAQRRSFRGGGGSGAPIAPNARYDGTFTFVRLRYGPPIAYQTQRAEWSHDYPTGERNLMKIFNEITFLGPHVEETNILALDDPELFKYPLSYLCEPGGWYVTDEEAANFRVYLQKGGFVIVDDFHWDDWANFESQMRRVLPGVRFIELDVSHPIFHSFFEISEPQKIPQFYDAGEPVFLGVYEDNDPGKRLMMAISYNTDISEFWEFSGTGLRPIDESNEAFKIGVNFFMYGLIH